jgi:hypothetical protein
MRRGKSQVLYRNLPTMLMDFQKCIVQITKWDCDEIRDINKTRVVHKIHKKLERYPRKRGFPSSPNLDEYIVLEPRRIEARVRPLTFICNNSDCNAAFSFYLNSAYQVLRKFGRKFKCPRCKKGDLFQWDMIYFDDDGYIDFVAVPPRFMGKDVYIMRTGKKPSNWRWVDRSNREDSISLNKRNNNTSHMMYPKPFRISSAMYLVQEEFINISPTDEEIIFNDMNAAKVKIAEYLGILEEKNVSIHEMLKAKITTEQQLKTERTIQTMRDQGVADSVINKILQSLKNENPSENEKKLEILTEIEKNVQPENDDFIDLALDVFDYIETMKLPNIKEIKTVVKESREQKKSNIHIIKNFPDTFKRIGVKNAFIVRDLNILSTVYGYTRKYDNPSKAILRRFHTSEDEDDEQRIPIFGSKKSTEGIVLEFDRNMIIRWLLKNEIKIDKKLLTSNEKELKIWFINNIQTNFINSFTYIPDEANIVTRRIYTLIHTISHALLSQASFQCGYEKESLGEIILPTIPAVILYFKARSDYQLGGMYTLFENFVIPWIDDTERLVRSCIYDPVCKNTTGACHACLHLSEGSCEHFNKDLDRNLLTGNKKKNIIGFWSNSFRGDT